MNTTELDLLIASVPKRHVRPRWNMIACWIRVPLSEMTKWWKPVGVSERYTESKLKPWDKWFRGRSFKYPSRLQHGKHARRARKS